MLDATSRTAKLYAASACIAANDDLLVMCCRASVALHQHGIYPVTVLHVHLDDAAPPPSPTGMRVPSVTHQCTLEMDADLFAADALHKWSGLRHQAVLDATGALMFVAERYRDEGSVLMRFDARSGALLQRASLGACVDHARILVAQAPCKRDFYLEQQNKSPYYHGCALSIRCTMAGDAQQQQQQQRCVYQYTPLGTDPIVCTTLNKALRGDDGWLVRLVAGGSRRATIYKRAWHQ